VVYAPGLEAPETEDIVLVGPEILDLLRREVVAFRKSLKGARSATCVGMECCMRHGATS
jgi:hypothetical protein